MTILLKLEEIFDDIEEWYREVDEKVEEALDQVYEKVPGKYFGLVGLIICVISTFGAVYIYLSVDPSYSFFTHWISHLGDGPNGANYLFNIGLIISSFILFFFYVYEIRTFRKKGVKEVYLDLLSLTSLVYATGAVLVGLFPLHLGLIHTIVGTIYFVGAFGFTMLYGSVVLSLSEVSNVLALAAYSTATCYLLYFLSPMITDYASNLGIPITIYFLEWLTLIAEILLMVMIVLYHFLMSNNQSKLRIQA